jgi:hypothetical protein
MKFRPSYEFNSARNYDQQDSSGIVAGDSSPSRLFQCLSLSHGSGQTFGAAWSWIRPDKSGSLAAVIVKRAPQYAEAHSKVAAYNPLDSRLIWPREYAQPFALLLESPEVLSGRFSDADLEMNGHVEAGIVFENEGEEWDDDIARTYAETLSYIGSLHSAVRLGRESSRKLCQRLIGFGAMLPPRFLQLIRDNRPRALVVMALFFAASAVESLSEVWWVGDAGTIEVHAIKEELPLRWRALLGKMLQKCDEYGEGWSFS